MRCRIGIWIRWISCSLKTWGKKKPLKYPTIFNSADVAIITKNELAAAVEFDWEAARTSIQSVRPGMQIFRLSAKTGEGMEEYFNFLSKHLAEQVQMWKTTEKIVE